MLSHRPQGPEQALWGPGGQGGRVLGSHRRAGGSRSRSQEEERAA